MSCEVLSSQVSLGCLLRNTQRSPNVYAASPSTTRARLHVHHGLQLAGFIQCWMDCCWMRFGRPNGLAIFRAHRSCSMPSLSTVANSHRYPNRSTLNVLRLPATASLRFASFWARCTRDTARAYRQACGLVPAWASSCTVHRTACSAKVSFLLLTRMRAERASRCRRHARDAMGMPAMPWAWPQYCGYARDNVGIPAMLWPSHDAVGMPAML